MVRRATISISNDVLIAIENERHESGIHEDVETIIENVLNAWLAGSASWGGRQVQRARSFLSITPADVGSGKQDISINHDRYLVEL